MRSASYIAPAARLPQAPELPATLPVEQGPMRNHVVPGLCAVVLMIAAACDRGPDMSAITVVMIGDSIARLQERELAQGVTVVDCPVQFAVQVPGPEGGQAILQGGKVDYFWWQTGAPAATQEWDQQEVARLWGDSILAAGETRVSRPQGFGQQPPGQLVRGEAVFEYRTSNTQEVKRTEPFRFYCY
jgi:hypothetical protein